MYLVHIFLLLSLGSQITGYSCSTNLKRLPEICEQKVIKEVKRALLFTSSGLQSTDSTHLCQCLQVERTWMADRVDVGVSDWTQADSFYMYWRDHPPAGLLGTRLSCCRCPKGARWCDALTWSVQSFKLCRRIILGAGQMQWIGLVPNGYILSLIHIWRCRRRFACRSRWSPYH